MSKAQSQDQGFNMVEIQSIASSSSGNAYLVDDLLIECGMSIAKLRKALHYRLSSVCGCLLSHAHKDHSKAAHDIMTVGIDLYTSHKTAESLNLLGHRLQIIKPLKQFKLKDWIILPFDVMHDIENLGFLIYKGGEKILFAIDTPYIKYQFKKLTHIMIECNYQTDVLDRNISQGLVDKIFKKRLIKSHFSLTNVIKFLKSNDLSYVKAIYLLHSSRNNCNPKEIKKAVQAATGKIVYIC
jgi:phosphoribosyl 1,2-cyclic phosphodiesterase